MRSIVGWGNHGTKYHLAVTRDGLPVACAATGANVNDTVLFERLFCTALAVMGRIGTAYADREYDVESNRALCRGHAIGLMLDSRLAEWTGNTVTRRRP